MKDLQLARDVLPIGKFKGRMSEMIRRVRTEGRPLVVTLNGEPAAVLVSPEEYDRMTSARRVRRDISEGLADVAAGRSLSDEALTTWADQRYGSTRKTR
jgi:prevent-host-death family protein